MEPPLIISLSATDADNDYLQYYLASHPTTDDGAGTLNHVNLPQRIPNTDETSAQLVFTPKRIGATSFNYTVTDGRTNHNITNTITVSIPNLDSLTTDNIFFDGFENGLGFWVAVNDDDGDTHDYDFWTTGADGQASVIDFNYAYIRDCDTGCTLTMRNAADISEVTSPRLEADIWIDGIRERDGDFYKLEVLYNNDWITLDSYTRDTIRSGQWHEYSKDLTPYKSSSFKFRLNVQGEGSSDYHIIDNVRIFDFVQTRPHTVTGLSVSSAPTQNALSWSIPFDGNSAITGYKIQRAADNPTGFVTIQSSYGSGSATLYTDANVVSGTIYYYKVSAINDQGTGPASQIVSGMVPHVPTAPAIADISDMAMSASDIAIVTVTVTDINGDVASITFAGLPDFATTQSTTQNTATLVFSPTSDNVGTYDITVTATDATTRTDTERFRVTVLSSDTTPPVFTVVPPNITTTIPAAGGGDSVTVTFDIPAATDNEGTVNVSCDPSSGSTFGVGTTKVICTATDTAGNSSDISFSVTVIADSVIPPPISVPNNAPILIVTPLSQTATSGDTVIINATVSDPDGDTVTVVWDPYTNVDVVFEESDDGLSTSIEVPYHPTRESVTVYTQVIATDEHGASTTVTSRVIMSLSSVPADTTPPVFSVVPPNITTTIPAAGGGDSVTVTFDLPTATDNEGTVNVSCDPSSGSTFDVGTTTVMCIATDSAENSSVISFYVTVTTATPPLNPVPNRDPIVTITSIPENPVSGDTVILYATVHDPDGDPVSVTWELYNSIDVIFEVSGDGLSASFEAPYHPTRERENGTLVVTATDSHQASTTVFYTVRMGLTSE